MQNDRILDDLKRKIAVRLKLCYLLVAGGAAFLIAFTMARGLGPSLPEVYYNIPIYPCVFSLFLEKQDRF